jgi:prepilin-type N-terminal cleavage/methylation domain-containing protein
MNWFIEETVTRGSRRRVRPGRLRISEGFSLVELMVVMVVSVIIIGAIYTTYNAQQRSFVVQDQVAEMNSSSRIALNIIANEIREMGFGVPPKDILNTTGINQVYDVVKYTDSTIGPDQLTIIGGFTKVGTLCSKGGGGPIGPDDTTLVLAPLPNTTTIDINTTDKKNINFGGYASGVVTSGGGAATSITLQNGIGKAFPKYADLNGNGKCDDGEGVPVYLVEDHTFRVVLDATCNCNVLQRVKRLNGGGTPDIDILAQYVEDFQVAYGVDTDDDGIVDTFKFAPDNLPLNLSLDNILKVRLNLLVRTGREDPNFQGQGNPTSNPIGAIENNNNHPPTNDGFRRRWWQMEVNLRNPL